MTVEAEAAALSFPRHCEERSDEAIHLSPTPAARGIASLRSQ
jgi:hypothetical protein